MAVNEVYFEHPHEQPLQVQEPPPLHLRLGAFETDAVVCG